MPFNSASNYVTTSSTVTATGWTAAAGSDRVIAIILNHEEGNTSRPITACTFGGVSAALYGRGVGGSGANNCYVELWYILESSIGSIASNPVLTLTPSASATSVQAATIITLTGCDQTYTNWTATPTNIYSDVSVGPVSTSVTSTTGGVIVGGMTCSNQTNGFTCDSPLVEITSSDRAFNSSSRAVAFYYDVVTGSSQAIGGDNANTTAGVTQNIYAVNIPAASTNPTISSTSDDTPTDGSTLTLTGTNFEASQGTGGVTAGGVGWTETSWSATSIQVTVALGDNKYNTNVSLVVTNNSGLSSSGYNVQIQPASGKSYVNLSGTLATEGDRITAVPDLASGDQLEISNVVGGTISDVTVNADGSFSVTAGVTAFDVRVNDGTWSVAATQYVAEPGSDATSKRGLVRALVRPLTIDIARDISA